MDQPGKVANPARGQLNRENNIPLSPCMPENLVSRDGFSRPVPRQPAHLHTQAESGAYLRDSSRVPRRRPFMKPPYAIGPVPSLSGHAIAYRWRSLPRVRRHRASKPQGSSERVLPWQITMDQLIFASLSHTHYWYEVGMLKVPECGRCYAYWVHGCEPGRISYGSRLALCQTLSIECPSSIFFWHVYFVILIPFSLSFLFVCVFLLLSLELGRCSSDLFQQTTCRIGNHVYYWV